MGRWKLLAAVAVVLSARPALSQNATTGAIRGRVEDKQHHPFFRHKILIEDERGRRSVETGADGSYVVDGLLPGRYGVELEASDMPFLGIYVNVAANTSTNVMFTAGIPTVSTLDPTSATLQSVTDSRFLDLPLASRYSEGIEAYTPTAHFDSQGIAFGDTTSYDNRHTIDGLDTTDIATGRYGTQLPFEFLSSVTSTYAGAQLGRSLGADVASVIRSGTNRLQGTAFVTHQSSSLAGAAPRTPAEERERDTNAIVIDQAYADDMVGATLGGPIIRDHAWFFAAVAPTLTRTTTTRTLRSLQDTNKDGKPDTDAQGRQFWNPVSKDEYTGSSLSVPIVAKVDAAIANQQASLALVVVPTRTTDPAMDGAASTERLITSTTLDLVGHWAGHVGPGTVLDVTAGWHRERWTSDGASDDGKQLAEHAFVADSFAGLAQHHQETLDAIDRCVDNTSTDRFPLIENCPLQRAINSGGVGYRERFVDERRTIGASATQYANLWGHHEIRAAASFDFEKSADAEVLSGGEFVNDEPNPNLDLVTKLWRGERTADGFALDADCLYFNGKALPSDTHVIGKCHAVGSDLGAPDALVHADPLVFNVDISDRWQPHADVTILYGLRRDDEHVGDLKLGGNWNPHLGVVVDPTSTGRSKLFAQYARSTELLPAVAVTASSRPGLAEVSTGSAASLATMGFVADPALKAGSRDDLLAGAAYQLEEGLQLQAAWTHRHLRRAIDDIFIYGTDTNSYSPSNGDPTTASFTGNALANPGEGIASDREKARRDYDAVTLSASQRFSSRLFVEASYTRSRVVGTYPGPLDDANGQYAPQHGLVRFDVVDSDVNLYGPLAADRPDYLKLDGAYTQPIGTKTAFVVGVRFRALSGTARPILAQGSYDDWVLPSGSIGRTPFVHELDTHLAVRHAFTPMTTIEVFADIFDLDNSTAIESVDSQYGAFDNNVRPIVGGSFEDLTFAKSVDSRGVESNTPVHRSTTFGEATRYYAPISATLGARVTF